MNSEEGPAVGANFLAIPFYHADSARLGGPNSRGLPGLESFLSFPDMLIKSLVPNVELTGAQVSWVFPAASG